MNRTVDARGMACPLPVVNAKKAAEEMKTGDTLVILVDNEIAVQNLTRFAEHKGYGVVSEKKAEKEEKENKEKHATEETELKIEEQKEEKKKGKKKIDGYEKLLSINEPEIEY